MCRDKSWLEFTESSFFAGQCEKRGIVRSDGQTVVIKKPLTPESPRKTGGKAQVCFHQYLAG